MKLLVNALTKFLLGLVLLGALIFLPAGTFDYLGGWIFMAALFIPVLIMGGVLFIKAPTLLEKRLKNKEKEKEQKSVVALSGLVFIGGFVVSGLDFRFGWSNMPRAVMIISALVFVFGYALFGEVMRENAYLSRIVEVQAGQKVIDSGLYGIVRHPMYMSTVLMFLAMPLILGSWYAFILFCVHPFLLASRIKNEEKILTEGLSGYSEYKQKVKYRMIPFIW
ncbi:MAG: isoprenylcysteine carboxylmethyltransferase family protein [Clostridia bacterium]|nr:isoprenylcysteine carboxylmethyltransferase family protein [Clostridia bacterium]